MVDERSDELAPGPIRLQQMGEQSWVRRRMHVLLWLASLVVFVIGCYVGWNINANAGAILWGVAAVLGFLPFLSHRHDDEALSNRRAGGR